MSKTPRTDEQCCEASAEELCKAALKHYDYVSTKALEWSNQIPPAIRFWYLEKPRLERELAAARQSAPAADTVAVPKRLTAQMLVAGANIDPPRSAGEIMARWDAMLTAAKE